MGLESATYIPELTITNPVGATDPKSEGDDHLRLIKKTLGNTFGAFVGTAGTPKSVTLTEDQINDASQKSGNETIAGDKTHTGFIVTDDSTTTRAGFNIPTGVAPTSPAQGDIWAVADDLLARINGVSVSLLSGPALPMVTKWKTADTARTTDAVLSDDPQLAGWTLDSASYYKLTAFLVVNVAASTTPDFQWLFQTSQNFVEHRLNYTATSNSSVVVQDSDELITTKVIQMASSARTGLEIHGFVRTHATLDATVDFQWAQAVSSGFSTTLEDASWITFEKLN